MYIASRNLLAACFILTLPAALIARPFPTDGAAATTWDDFVRQFTKSNQERAKANSFDEGLDMTNKEIQNQAEDRNIDDPFQYEGDIALTKDDVSFLHGPTPETEAEIQKIQSDKMWPNGIIYYQLDDNLHERTKNAVLGVMIEYEEKTCLRFKETTTGPRLNITSKLQGCWSYIGRQNNVQTLSLGPGCYWWSTARHELGHSIGFWHEQTRPDRDRYIIVQRDNIYSYGLGAYKVVNYANYQGEPYNFNSIMHYSTKDFSNGPPTMTVRDEELYEIQQATHIGSAGQLTDIDIRQINKQYGCYVPNTSPGALHVRVLQAGPFQDPGHYYFCLKTRDANKNEQSKCSEEDPLRTTDPEWKTELIFHSDVPFYSFDITIKKADKFILFGQTIWVESKEHADKYYTTMEQSVLYEYKIIE